MARRIGISIVTPSLNQGKYLSDAIESVVGQAYPNLEYVVIDGGSSDGSVEIIKRFASQLSYWQSAPDDGHADALNRGFARTSGEVMGFLNADDKYHEGAFSVVADIFERFPEVAWISGVPSVWNAEGGLVSVAPRLRNAYDYVIGHVGERHWIQQESVFWRRSLWKRAGGEISRRYQHALDFDLWMRFFRLEMLYYVARPLGGFRSHGLNRSVVHRREYEKEVREILKDWPREFGNETQRYARALRQLHCLKRIPLVGSLPIDRMGDWLAPSAYQAAEYRVLVNENGAWTLRRIPFRV